MTLQHFDVKGMTCAACSAHVEKAVAKVAGVQTVSVSLLTNSMQVEFDKPATEELICTAVSDAGYGASVSQEELTLGALEDKETPRLKRRLFLSLILLAFLVYVSMGAMMAHWPIPSFMNSPLGIALYEMILTLAIMVLNRAFFISGFKSLLAKAPNMDTLVALGSSAAFLYSLAMTIQMVIHPNLAMTSLHDLYYESAGMILTLITVGKTLEARSKGKTTDAIRGLLQLTPSTARKIQDGKEIMISIGDLAVGDTYLVKPGESIPADGEVLEGNSAVNESALTGESLPVEKEAGSKVSAATLNQNGSLLCRAIHVGKDTTLSQIVRLVEDAATTKAPIAQIADKIAGIFVPVVMGIALITGIVWLLVGQTFSYALARMISVLVISCPCALGLATPVAIMVGNGVGAKRGILFKTATALENTGKTQIVVMDKTGTLTTGQPTVQDVLPQTGVSKEELLQLAASLEASSEHPLAKAITEAGSSLELIPVTQFQALPGAGVQGLLRGKRMEGGSLSYFQEKGLVSSTLLEEAQGYASLGKTPLFFAEEDRLLGCITVSDTLRPTTKEAIAALKEMGCTPVMLSGDNERTAQVIAKEAGIDACVAEVLPQDKATVIQQLAKYGKVCMVGDGINDAPALTLADVGIAIGAGSDIALDAADVVLVKSDPMDIVVALRLSKATVRNIHENLFWAFFYNACGIPLAAGVFTTLLGWSLNPMFGAAAMSLSSFCVVTNALRLNWFDPKKKVNGSQSAVVLPKEALAFHSKKEEKRMKKTIQVEGMMCKNCVAHVQKALEGVEGVKAVTVTLEPGQAVVESDHELDASVLEKAIDEAGYKVISIA